ncbi:interferon lambda-3-like [Cricetulus griseus]|uniref:interferon lambda-3-like n=1 Tax=Cricetulus griseus TaxID=10029 RepID=UPI0004544C76|nr:interferon lambda-3-like [Cricetulus griseus]
MSQWRDRESLRATHGKTQARDTEQDQGSQGQPRGLTRIPRSSQTPESSMKPAGGRLLLLLLLLAAVLTGTRAAPVPRPTRLPPDAKDCHIARFKSLSPQEREAFLKATVAIIQPEPAAEPRPPSHRLSRWLHRLREAQEKETPGCLEISVTSNLFRMLLRDLPCVARGDQCA